MARPVDTEKRQELCHKALEYLRNHGLSVSTAALAKGLGVKRPTLLYHFPDRSSIFETALEELLSEQAIFVVGRMMSHEHPIDQLFEQIRSVHLFHHKREKRLLFLTQALAVVGEKRTSHIVEIGNQAFMAHRKAMLERLRNAIAGGQVRPIVPEALIQICRATVDGLMVQRVMLDCDLLPVYELLWNQLLGPLRIPQRSFAELVSSIPTTPTNPNPLEHS